MAGDGGRASGGWSTRGRGPFLIQSSTTLLASEGPEAQLPTPGALGALSSVSMGVCGQCGQSKPSLSQMRPGKLLLDADTCQIPGGRLSSSSCEVAPGLLLGPVLDAKYPLLHTSLLLG